MNNTEFIDGSLHNGIAIEGLIKKLKYGSFSRTKQWVKNGKSNFSVRTVFANQGYVELTAEPVNWLNEVFESRLEKFGRVNEDFLKTLPRP